MLPMLESVPADLKSAWKGVRAGRWASLLAVMALALGTGVCLTTAVLAYAGFLRPLPLTDADRLVTLRRVFVTVGVETGIRLAEFDTWRDRLSGTIALAGYVTERTTLRESQSEPRDVRAAYVTGEWFTVLGARAEAGRLIDGLTPLDAAVVSHAFAARLLGGSPGPAATLNRTFTLGGRTLSIIGVLPESFSVVDKADVWIAARGVAALTPTGLDDVRSYQLIGRVRPGRSMDEAKADAARVLASVVPENQRANYRSNLRTLRATLMGDARPVLLAFLAASGLVLLVACANVAMLLVNRAVARARELSVRLALGASRGRLLRVAVLETAILAIAGAALGAWITEIATGVLAGQTGLDLPRLATFTSTEPVLLGALALAVFVVIVCGAAPILTLRQLRLATSLRAPAATGSRGSRRLRAVLVVSQMAMAIVLLTGAGLLGRTLLMVSRADIGLDQPQQVVTLAVPIGESTLDPAGRLAVTDRILADVRRLPGVIAAGLGSALPPANGGIMFTIRVSSERTDATRTFDLVPVTPGYLESLGARLVSGRLFNDGDDIGDPVTVLSESAVTHLALVTKTTLDRQLNLPLPTAKGPRVKPRIIGVIKDVRYSGLDTAAHGGVYVPWRQLPLPRAFLTVRTAGDPSSLLQDITRVVRTVDPSLPLDGAKPLDRVIETTLAPRAARFGVVGVFAAGAILLAFLGLSGALVRSVVEQQRELAIRAAVGATPRMLLASVLRQGAVLALAGVVAGLAASAALARAVSTLFFGVTPHDPLTYAATASGVLLVAIAACYVPARRAAASDPILLLRAE